MASESAWNAGWSLGSQLAQERYAHKQALSDEEFQTHFGEIQQSIGNLQNRLADTAPGSVENLQARDALAQAVQSRNDLFHPAKNPGALQKFGHLLRLTHPKQAQPVAPPVYGQSTIQQPAYMTEPVRIGAEPGYQQYAPTDPRLVAVGQAFPRLAPYLSNVQVQQGTKAAGDERSLEFYPPWESQNPNPGKITLELFDQMQGPKLTSALGGDLLHYLGGKDPQTGKLVDPQYFSMKQAVLKARTPQQEALDRRVYEDAKKNQGETRTYEDWLQQSRIDAYIRGYVTPALSGKYPDEWRKQGMYKSPAMLKAVEQIRQYVTTPPTAQGGVRQISTVGTEPGLPAMTIPGMEVGAEPAIPAGPAYEVRGPQNRRQLKAQAEANLLAAGAPLSPEQQAEQQARAGIVGKEAQANWALDWAQRHGIQGTALDELTEHIAGLPQTKPAPLAGLKPYKGADGRYYQAMRNPDGTITAEPMPADYVPPPAKPPTSKFGMNVESYKQLHGIPAEQPLTPEQLNFVEQQIALSSAAPSTNVTNTLKQDFRGFWVPIQEMNRRIPGFGYILSDPLGSVPETPGETVPGTVTPSAPSVAGAPGGVQVPPGVVPKTPAEAKKQAQVRRKEIAAPKTTGAGNVRVGPELFAAPSKQYNDTKTAYDAAVDRMNTMDKNLVSALRRDQQAMLSLVANHIGMTLGAQKGARINQAVWNEAVETAPWLARAAARFDSRGLLSGVTLAPDQMRQMVNLAHEKVEVLKEDLDHLTQELSTPAGATPPTSSSGEAIPSGWK